jgi:TPR repeat protein
MNRLGAVLLLFCSSTGLAGFDEVDGARRACDAGDGTACYNLGVLYAEGKSVEYDFVKVIEYYGKGCDGGNENACEALGYEYYNGGGVRHDYVEAIKVYEKGCDDGIANACNALGHAYYKGGSVRRDYVRAVSIMKKDVMAAIQLPVMHLVLLTTTGMVLITT